VADDSKELCASCLLGFCIVLRFLHEKSDVALSVADELAWRLLNMTPLVCRPAFSGVLSFVRCVLFAGCFV